jgi:hypothetical protein
MDPGLATIEHGLSSIDGVAKAPLLSLPDSIQHSGLKGVKANVVSACKFAKWKLSREPEIKLSADEIAAIHLYTQQCDLYRKLNEALRDRKRVLIKPFLPYLRLLVQALRQLPSCSNKVVFRGVTKDLSDKIRKHDELVWWGLSSTSTDLETMSNPEFCGKVGDRTIFNIQVQHAKDINILLRLAPSHRRKRSSCFRARK